MKQQGRKKLGKKAHKRNPAPSHKRSPEATAMPAKRTRMTYPIYTPEGTIEENYEEAAP